MGTRTGLIIIIMGLMYGVPEQLENIGLSVVMKGMCIREGVMSDTVFFYASGVVIVFIFGAMSAMFWGW